MSPCHSPKTLTENKQFTLLPNSSVAVTCTSCSPTPNSDPFAGLLVKVTAVPLLSVTTGSSQVTVIGRGPASTFWSSGHPLVKTGGSVSVSKKRVLDLGNLIHIKCSNPYLVSHSQKKQNKKTLSLLFLSGSVYTEFEDL